jgi:hypothetical protein
VSLATAGGLRDNLASTGFALLAAALLGVVITSGEFRLKTATDTYLDQPDRGRVLAAKAIAAAAAGTVLGIAAAATATGIALGFAASRGYPLALSDPAIARRRAGPWPGMRIAGRRMDRVSSAVSTREGRCSRPSRVALYRRWHPSLRPVFGNCPDPVG